MDFVYKTKNLTMMILDETYAVATLRFLEHNKADFQQWEPKRPAEYFTEDYQRTILSSEIKLFLDGKGVRYWLFAGDNLADVIGTVSFTGITRGLSASCKLGYRLDSEYRKHGYASEAILYLLPLAADYYHLHRIEADVMPGNIDSVHLLEHLGFTLEGTSRKYFEINGIYEDHLRYALLDEEIIHQ